MACIHNPIYPSFCATCSEEQIRRLPRGSGHPAPYLSRSEITDSDCRSLLVDAIERLIRTIERLETKLAAKEAEE